MRAYTPTFRISLENQSTLEGNSDIIDSYKIENINFGIIDTPKISLGFEKTMTNITVTNIQGNTIVGGNPGNPQDLQQMKQLSNLDEKATHLTQGSDFAKIEISNEEIYGAKLKITYSITIINDSDINYYEDEGSHRYGYYYMFGDKTGAKEANITIDQVNDYLDSKLNLVENGYDHSVSNKDTYKNNSNILNIDSNWKALYSQKRAATNTRPIQDTANIIVTTTLSNEFLNLDTAFENRAEVMEIHVTDYPKLIENVNMHNDSQYTNYFNYEIFNNPSRINVLTIIPPTGADMISILIYGIVTIIASIIITIGIIVIKKKVL